jgi:hypothetical protein
MTDHYCIKMRTLDTLEHHYDMQSCYITDIRQCMQCGQLWKIFFQWTDTNGHHNVYLRPGEQQGPKFAFPQEEAAQYV